MGDIFKTMVAVEVSGDDAQTVARWRDAIAQALNPVTSRLVKGKDAKMMLVSTRTCAVLLKDQPYHWEDLGC